MRIKKSLFAFLLSVIFNANAQSVTGNQLVTNSDNTYMNSLVTSASTDYAAGAKSIAQAKLPPEVKSPSNYLDFIKKTSLIGSCDNLPEVVSRDDNFIEIVNAIINYGYGKKVIDENNRSWADAQKFFINSNDSSFKSKSKIACRLVDGLIKQSMKSGQSRFNEPRLAEKLFLKSPFIFIFKDDKLKTNQGGLFGKKELGPGKKALGVLVSSKEIVNDEETFTGVLAHELTHYIQNGAYDDMEDPTVPKHSLISGSLRVDLGFNNKNEVWNYLKTFDGIGAAVAGGAVGFAVGTKIKKRLLSTVLGVGAGVVASEFLRVKGNSKKYADDHSYYSFELEADSDSVWTLCQAGFSPVEYYRKLLNAIKDNYWDHRVDNIDGGLGVVLKYPVIAYEDAGYRNDIHTSPRNRLERVAALVEVMKKDKKCDAANAN